MVTGANSGIGFAAAEVWAARGARVTLVCRNAERGADAQAALRALSPSAHIELIVADLSELSAVATVTSQLEGPIHALVHNAGNMVHELQHSPDGFEIITALHVIVPYALTQALLPQLKAGAQEGCGRIIFVSSGGMYTQPFDVDALETALSLRWDPTLCTDQAGTGGLSAGPPCSGVQSGHQRSCHASRLGGYPRCTSSHADIFQNDTQQFADASPRRGHRRLAGGRA